MCRGRLLCNAAPIELTGRQFFRGLCDQPRKGHRQVVGVPEMSWRQNVGLGQPGYICGTSAPH
jgi:hypothetical protein